MGRHGDNLSLDAALANARERYAARNPNSRAAVEKAAAVLPGGNTRSVLFFEPFPLTMERGAGAELFDVDGHGYGDFVGELSAGLYGHSDPVIRAAIIEALDGGLVLAAPTRREEALASVLTARFPAVEQIRFCNSGTEANILALVTAVAVTGRKKILVFREAYHGGVLTFPPAGSPINLPFDFVLGDYNDTAGASALIRAHGRDLAAVVVEPILGAAGNIPGTAEFLHALRRETEATGTLLIFDEVKTSRCGPGGMQGELGIAPDLTTLGKYIGGGLPTGAFGGRKDIMSRFDPRRPDALRHAGTFNNNVCSMAAGWAGLTRVFTADRARRFLDESERFRQQLVADMAAAGAPAQITGLGSMISIHFAARTITSPKHIPPTSRRIGQLLHLECMQDGVLIASRGDAYFSLPMDDTHRSALRRSLGRFVNDYASLIRREVGEVQA